MSLNTGQFRFSSLNVANIAAQYLPDNRTVANLQSHIVRESRQQRHPFGCHGPPGVSATEGQRP
jgi:hypothetical protein